MPKNATPAVPKYDVKIRSIRPEGSCKATASVNVYGDFAVRGIKIMYGAHRQFLSMPSHNAGNGDYLDSCLHCTKEAKAEFDKAVLGAYQQTLTQGQTTAQKQESPAQQQEQDQPVMGGM